MLLFCALAYLVVGPTDAAPARAAAPVPAALFAAAPAAAPADELLGSAAFRHALDEAVTRAVAQQVDNTRLRGAGAQALPAPAAPPAALPAPAPAALAPAAPAAGSTRAGAAGLASIGHAPASTVGGVEVKGQVSARDGQQGAFGRELERLAQLPNMRNMLELGTWYGGGSSLCLARGLQAANAREKAAGGAGDRLLVTIEAFEEAHEHARKTLAGYPVRLVLGTTVPLADVPTADQVAADGGVCCGTPRSEWEGWLEGERANMAKFNNPQLAPLCALFQFDFVLIDAGEFAGNAEWRIVRDACKPRVVALHDTHTYKTRKVLQELSAAQDWRLVSRGDPPEMEAGWAIFERK